MNTSPPKLFDEKALAFAKSRARKRQARRGGSFLYQRAAQDAASRLEDIQRQFKHAVMIGAQDGRNLFKSEISSDRIPETFDYVQSGDQLTDKYDLIISLLELQSDDALPETLMRFRHHLSPDGLLLVAQIGGESLTELRQSLYGTDQVILGGATPRIFPMVDYSQAAMLLGKIGLALPVVDTDRITVFYSALENLISDLRDLGLSNSLIARDKRSLPKAWWVKLNEIYAQHFSREDDGKLKATFEILWLTGWAPHESQQKPLKPGSAKMRLSDALKTQEQKLKRD